MDFKKKKPKVKDLSGQDDFLPSLVTFHPQNPHVGRRKQAPTSCHYGAPSSLHHSKPIPTAAPPPLNTPGCKDGRRPWAVEGFLFSSGSSTLALNHFVWNKVKQMGKIVPPPPPFNFITFRQFMVRASTNDGIRKG